MKINDENNYNNNNNNKENKNQFEKMKMAKRDSSLAQAGLSGWKV